MNKAFYDLIYLCKCAVNQKQPDRNKVSEMDMEQLYKVSKYHTLTAIIAYSLESAGMKNREFRQAREKAIRKNLLFDRERMKLFSYFEKTGIWYMPLKGIILKELYPVLGMRQMADNDILFDSDFQKKVKEYFESEQYEVISFNKGNHDIYEKAPVLSFEMHTSLFGVLHDEKWQKYYADVKSRLVKDSDNHYGYHFSDEDFYIYITTHEYKHYSNSGTGVRSLLDCYVYLREKSKTLDWAYIELECQKLGIDKFEMQSRELAYKVFGSAVNAELSETDMEMLEHYLNSGTYGTIENSVKAQMKKYADKTGNTSKFKYFLSRIFPNMEFYKKYYPLLYRYKIFIPFFLVFRTIRAVFFRRKKVKSELDIIRKS